MKNNNPVLQDQAMRDLKSNVVESLDVNQAVAVFLMNPRYSFLAKNLSSTATGNATLMTTSATRDTYIAAIMMNYTKDGVSDATRVFFQAVMGGASTVLASLRSQTTTATNGNIFIAFPFPIKVDKSSSFVHSTTFTVGTISFETTVIYFEV